MDTTKKMEFMGRIKEAEMELSEAALKASDGELQTARACLIMAAKAISVAMDAIRE